MATLMRHRENRRKCAIDGGGFERGVCVLQQTSIKYALSGGGGASWLKRVKYKSSLSSGLDEDGGREYMSMLDMASRYRAAYG